MAKTFTVLNYYDEIASPQVYHKDSYTWEYDEAYLTTISSHEDLIGKKLYLADPAGGDRCKRPSSASSNTNAGSGGTTTRGR